jgi:hypothetical protein
VLGPVAGSDRGLRIDRVLGGSAHPGNRNPAGSGSGIEPHQKHDAVSRTAAGCGRRGVRARCGFRAHTLDLELSVWRQGVGSLGLLRSAVDFDRCGADRDLVTGDAREPDRPNSRSALRIGTAASLSASATNSTM